MILAGRVFILFILLKQFYIFKSGGIQPADFLLVISLGILIYLKKIYLDKKDIYIVFFLFIVWVINLLWMIKYPSRAFFMSSIYYLFNFFVIITFRTLIKQKYFLKNLLKVLNLILIIQIGIYFINIKEILDGKRYKGTFNDPNQMAFYIFMIFMISIIISNLRGEKIKIQNYIISLFLIIQTQSTGMLLGYLIVVVGLNILKLSIKRKGLINKRNMLIGVGVVVLVILCRGYIANIINNQVNLSGIESRLNEKLNRIGTEENDMNLIEERGIDRIFKYPKFVIIGAGEGEYNRFPKSFHKLEIHSTLLGILFSYGIIGLILIVLWIYINLKRVPMEILLIYGAVILESFTLANQRQPLFWMIFVLGSMYGLKDNSSKNNIIKNKGGKNG